jgi:hypothetical protein
MTDKTWGWGGWRPHAGRKPKDPSRPSEPHRKRPFSPSASMHVTARVVDGCPSLRDRRALAAVLADLGALAPSARERIRVTHYAVAAAHLHLVVEADDRPSFIRGLQSLFIRLAKNINTALDRHGHGQVFADRYHSRELDDVKAAVATFDLRPNSGPTS